MSQAYEYPVGSSDSAATAFTKTNNTFEAVVSNHIGGTAPTTTKAGMWWFDTTANWIKVRNAADSAWQEIAPIAKRAGLAASVVNWGTVSATETKTVLIVPSDSTIVRVGLVHTGSTTSSTDANDLEVMLRNATTAVDFFSGVATTFNNLAGVGGGNELAANVIDWFTVDQNGSAPVAGDVIELVLTFNAAFAATMTRFATVVEYYVRP